MKMKVKMKMVLMIIGMLLLVVVGFGLFRASQLRTIQITKSVIVNGSRQEVFACKIKP